MIQKVMGGIFGKVLDNAEGILDKVITTDKERDQAKIELQKIMLEAEREAFAKEVEDRKSARDMYKDDAIIQKVLATLFTVAYGQCRQKLTQLLISFLAVVQRKIVRKTNNQ